MKENILVYDVRWTTDGQQESMPYGSVPAGECTGYYCFWCKFSLIFILILIINIWIASCDTTCNELYKVMSH